MSQECNRSYKRYKSCAPVPRTNISSIGQASLFIILQNGLKIPHPALTRQWDARRKTEESSGTAMGTKPPSLPSHPKQRCFFLESSWTWGKSEGGRRFLGNEQASYRDCFPPRTNCSVPQRNPRAFILTLMGQGQGQGTGEVVVNGAYLPSFGTQREGRGNCWLLGSLRSYWPSQVTWAAVLKPPLTVWQSDVHFKLGLIPWLEGKKREV